jgi:hypothetical protein
MIVRIEDFLREKGAMKLAAEGATAKSARAVTLYRHSLPCGAGRW